MADGADVALTICLAADMIATMASVALRIGDVAAFIFSSATSLSTVRPVEKREIYWTALKPLALAQHPPCRDCVISERRPQFSRLATFWLGSAGNQPQEVSVEETDQQFWLGVERTDCEGAAAQQGRHGGCRGAPNRMPPSE